MCSTTRLFHYLRPDAAAGSVEPVVRAGLQPLSHRPGQPPVASEVVERRYRALAAPVLGPAHDGDVPLPAWAGFGVLCGWAALALTAAVLLLRRRDA